MAFSVLAGIMLLGCSEQKTIAPSPRVAVEDLVEGTATGWPSYGGQPSGTKYSALDQINTGNVEKLAVAWTYNTGEISTGTPQMDATIHQVTPIYANEKLYICTPLNRIVALDPATGKEIWKYDPGKPATGMMYGSHVCRGVSYWEAADPAERARTCGRRIFQAVSNGVLVAVDAESGKPCEEFGAGGRVDMTALDNKGEGPLGNTSPPAIFRDTVIVGSAVTDNKYEDSLDGIVRGFDARTGAVKWNWNPIPSELSSRTGAANTWAPISIDTKRGWVFLPTGSASYDTLGTNRLNAIPMANAVVVLDAETGQLVWSYQTVRHDLWDYDLPAQPTLATIEHHGRMVEAVLQPTKTGFLFVLDRQTGQPLFPVRDMPVPASDVPGERASPTQPVPTLPAPVTSQRLSADDAFGVALFDRNECRKKLAALRNDGLFTPPSLKGSILHPSFLGGTNWGGVAYDQESGLAVLNSSNLVASVTLMPRESFDPTIHARPRVATYEMRGSPYVMLREVQLSSLGVPCNPPPWGQLTAIDMKTGQTRWQIPFGRVDLGGPVDSLPHWGAPNQGGPIITRGGLIFIGASLDSRFRAYDLKTGEELWSHNVPSPATATPMTFRHTPNGKQYVVVAAGGHGGFQTKLSDAIVAFALPDTEKAR